MESIVLNEILNSKILIAGEEVVKMIPISGGCIHNAWRLELQKGKQLFAKTCKKNDFAMLEFESSCLTALNKVIDKDLLTVPQPIITQKLVSSAILIIPWLNLIEGNEKKLGNGLALLHLKTSKGDQGKFGWGKDGFIGYNPQIAGWEKSWGTCFVKLRLIPQIQMAAKWGLNFPLNEFSSKLIKYLDLHNPKPSLVHGDLWKGNSAVNENNGKGVIFDPASWWADREVDIGMTRLFGGFSKGFYNAYNEIWPLPDDYENRIDIYNLYHVLNHANLFGGAYKKQSLSLLNQVNTFLKKY